MVLMDEYFDGKIKIYEINENKFIFCANKYCTVSHSGPSHSYIDISEVEIKNKTKSDMKESSLKLESDYNTLFKYATKKGIHRLSNYIILNNKYFLIFVDNHLLIFDLIKSELMKRYTFLNKKKYKILKWNKSSDNEFLVIVEDNITLLELNEKNSNGKITLDLKIIGYTYLPLEYYSKFKKLDENRFYISHYDDGIFI